MENAVEALKIAFGFLIFVTAMTIAFMLFSQAKLTSDAVMFSSDNTNFYEYEGTQGENIVGVDTVIAMLYRYYTESLKIEVTISGETKSFDTSVPLQAGTTYKEEVDKYVKEKLLGNNSIKFYETFEESDGITKIKYSKVE